MGLLAWLILLAFSATLATASQYFFFRRDRRATDYDWVYIAGGSLLGGFTANAWYQTGPVIDGLYFVPALTGAVVLAAIVEGIYRGFIRRRQFAP